MARDDLTLLLMHGEGGGGGKGSSADSGGTTHTPQEAPNTLQSKTTVKILELISEGPIKGFPYDNAAKGVMMNAGSPDMTPMMAADGTWNFHGANVDYRLGLANQTAIPGFTEQVTPVVVNTQVSNQGDPVAHAIVRRVSDLSTSAIGVIVQLSALWSVDIETGDMNGYSVQYAIDIKSAADQVGAVFVTKVNETINGKCTSPWQKEYRIDVSGTTGPWDIRVRRLSPDDANSYTNSVLFFAEYEEYFDYNIGYLNSAIVGLMADTEQFGTSIPTRGYHVQGLIVKVPSNYNATTRVYTGVWDGTFTTAYTNNPAWVLYDLLTSNRYGVGDIFTAARLSLGKWDLYSLAKYCDGIGARPSGTVNGYGATGKDGVPDGSGGFEPRFTFNGVIRDKVTAYEAIAAILGMFRSAMLWANGQLRFMQDAPTTPTKIFSAANVVDGMFNYMGSALRARHTAVRVTWANPDMDYLPDDVVVEDDEAILRYGYNLKEETAFGCTSFGQAVRHARNILETEKLETDSVQFKIGVGEADLMPGQTFKVEDPSMTQAQWGGRLGVAKNGDVHLDASFPNDDLSEWTPWGSPVLSVINGRVHIQNGSGQGGIAKAFATIPGRTYQLQWSNYVGTVYGVAGIGTAPNVPNIYVNAGAQVGSSGNFVATGTLTWAIFYVGNGTAGASTEFDNLKVVDVTAATATSTVNQLILDRPITLNSGEAYTVTVVLPDGALADRPITNAAGTTRVLNFTTALAAVPVDNAMWVVSSNLRTSRQFRLISIAEDEGGTYLMTGVEYQSAKFDFIDTGVERAITPFSDLPPVGSVAPPTNLQLTYYTITHGSQTDHILECHWSPSTDYYVRGYKVKTQQGTDNWVEAKEQTDTTFKLINPKIGVVRFSVQTVNTRGRTSIPATIDVDLSQNGGALDGNLAPVSALWVQGTTSNEWTGRSLPVEWNSLSLFGLSTDGTGRDRHFRNFRLTLRDATTDAVLHTYITRQQKHTIPYMHMVGAGLSRTYKVGVEYGARGGSYSAVQEGIFTNPAPTLQSGTVTATNSQITINFDPSTDPDFEGTIVWMSTTAGFTPGSGNRVWKARGNPVLPVLPGTTYYFRYSPYDAFGETSIPISLENSITTPVNATDPAVTAQLNNLQVEISAILKNLVYTKGWYPRDISTSVEPNANGLYRLTPATIDAAGYNVISMQIGPSGTSEPVMKTALAPSTYGEGGFFAKFDTLEGFDPKKTYRFMAFVRRPSSLTAYVAYFGPGACLNLNGTANGNPYFISANAEPPIADARWYLLVGILHGSDYTGADTGQAGLYDIDTGQRLVAGTEFKSAAADTQQALRLFNYTIATNGTEGNWFARPAVVEVTDTNTTISNILSTLGARAGANLLDSGGAVLNDIDVDNAYNATQAQSTRALFFNQDFDLVLPGSVPPRPQGLRAGDVSNNSVDTRLGYVGGVAGSGLAVGINGSGEIQVAAPLWRVNPKATYRARGRVKCSSSNAANGFYLRFLELDSEPPSYVTHMAQASFSGDATIATSTRLRSSGTAALTGGSSIENAPVTTNYQNFDIQLVPTATAKFMGIQIWRYTGMGSRELHLESLVIEEITPTSVTQYDYTGDLNATFGASWATNLTGRPTELTDGRVGTAISGTGQLAQPIVAIPINGAGVRYYYNQAPTYTAAAGSPATATISVPAGVLRLGDNIVNYNAMSVNVTGTGGTTVTYFLYLDDLTYAGGTKSLVQTTSTSTPYNASARVFIGQINVTFPSSGTGGGTGTPGGGGGITGCPWEEAFVHTKRGWIKAKEVVKGDEVLVLREDGTGADEWEKVTANYPFVEPCFIIHGRDSRVRVTVSASTPITLRDGSVIKVAEIDGHELPFEGDGRFWWEACDIIPLEERPVCKIMCSDRTFSAGDTRGWGILTHNLGAKP
jgi:predicted phage tail protein